MPTQPSPRHTTALLLCLALLCGCGNQDPPPGTNNQARDMGPSLADMPGDMTADMSPDASEDEQTGAIEICTNGIDDDGVMGADCEDPACADAPSCKSIAQCGIDERVLDGKCVSCPPGTSNEPNDDATGPDTMCEPRLCEADFFVLENVCTPCPGITTNMAGDDASGPDTSCDGAMCPSNQYVADFTCVPCPVGTTNAAGDDLLDGDSECDPVLCEEDEYVSDNACVACPAGSTNTAGGDASGEDTVCQDMCTPLVGVPCAQFAPAYIKAAFPQGKTPNDNFGDAFGSNVAVDGDTLVVGVSLDSSSGVGPDDGQQDNSLARSGAAYVFERDMQGAWNQMAYLKASTPGELDTFGADVAIKGDTLVVAAHQYDAGGVSNSGRLYIFERNDQGGWDETATIDNPEPAADVFMGQRIAFDGERIIATTRGPRKVYMFERDAQGEWGHTETLQGEGGIDIDGDRVAIGEGPVRIYELRRGEWEQTATLETTDPLGNPLSSVFTQLDLDGDDLIIGILEDATDATGVNGMATDTSAPNSGAAFIYRHTGNGTWSRQAYLKASNSQGGDQFGHTVAIQGGWAVVGAPFEDSSATGLDADASLDDADAAGAVYVFERSSASWQQTAYLKTSNTGEGDRFGWELAIADGTLVVGARGEDSASSDPTDNTADDAGAVYVYGIGK